MNISSQQTNPLETSNESEIFFEMLSVPVYCNLLWPEQQAAQNCPKGDIKLAFRPRDGFIFNAAFDPSLLAYSQDYENSLHYSSRFQQYAESLAASLVERHNLYEKDIIEIGCGKGDFLISLCQLGNNRGVGFDPSYVTRQEHSSMLGQVQFVEDFYSERYQDYQADLICCRQTLEHILHPTDLLSPLRQAIGDRLKTIVFFEVPNALHTFRNLAVWDIIYEHCCYFTPTSLTQAFTSHGFEVCEQMETFEGQFFCLEALPVAEDVHNSAEQKKEVEALARDIATFKGKFDSLVATWEQNLAQIARAGKKAVVWGAGSKGVTFLNILKNQDSISYIVDLNPRKQGMYVAGTGQKIVPPEFLREYQPDVVIIMNPIYEGEIRDLTTGLGLIPEFICV